MDSEQQKIFRRALLASKEELEQLTEESAHASGTVELDQSMVGRLSRMDAMQAQQMAQELGRRRLTQRRNIVRALQRLDTGDYGFCVECDEEISIARLDFDPTSIRCVECMNQIE